MLDKKQVDGQEVAKHNSREKGVWIVVHGNVYDVSDFLDEHPGGAEIILRYAGKDATEEYEPIHPPDAIKDNLDPSKCLGALVPSSLPAEPTPSPAPAPPPTEVGTITAQAQMMRFRWENHNAYQRVWFRPRILRDVSSVDYSTTILGHKTSMPVYISATALGKLGHPEGEICLTKAAGEQDVIQMIPTLASCGFDEMVDAAIPGQVQFLQLYVNADRNRTKKLIAHAAERGVKALFITVDAPQLGRREKDMRTKFEGAVSAQQTRHNDKIQSDQGVARAISSFIDPSLNWYDLKELIDAAQGMKIVLKGVQCWEDAVMAAEAGVDGVVLSNHGGRQLDFAPSSLALLPSVIQALTARGFMAPSRPKNFEVFVDGGVRRATDVLKAVALGATAVGIGRPMIYAMSTYGTDGIMPLILQNEFEMNMRLLGAPTMSDVVPSMVETSALLHSQGAVTMYDDNYERMVPVGVRARL
ncbi:uncharacterized protein L203_106281 [Cryptococcus depauperatus CBS 7841]|uniref:L-lactate dehydrogenase (cytochrome) n=1 Tax=Cryptococcus depauperatus CBS 7841 TaxID=1295531 RepID=A0AAJ8JZ28_9TREE